MLRHRLTGALASGALALGLAAGGTITAAAGEGFTCSGGSVASPSFIPAGTYQSITVSGFCAPAPGTITVEKNFTVTGGGIFFGQLGASTVTIAGNVAVEPGGMFALGCAPSFDAPCSDDPTATTHDSIGKNLEADRPLLLILHNNIVGGNISVAGGGGGTSCNNLAQIPFTPPFVDFDSNQLGRNVSVTGLSTCWSGFSNNSVGGNVEWSGNQTGEPDGNFVGGNTIARNLSCWGNSPAPHLSDFAPIPNSVGRHTEGQCASEI